MNEANTNLNGTSGNWNEIKGKIRTKFSKLSNEEIDGFNGHMDAAVSKIKKVYGYTQEQAEGELADFRSVLERREARGSSSQLSRPESPVIRKDSDKIGR